MDGGSSGRDVGSCHAVKNTADMARATSHPTPDAVKLCPLETGDRMRFPLGIPPHGKMNFRTFCFFGVDFHKKLLSISQSYGEVL
jgi:hypothetical protein